MRWHSAGGFTLVEVLVAVFLLAVAVVGAAASQAVALQTRHQSGLMSDGVQIAATLAARMRANPAQMALADSANPYLQLNYDALAGSAAAAPAQLCHADANCDSAQMAAFDLYETTQAVFAGFPGGRVLVCRDAAVWDTTAAALAWECTPGGGAPIVIKLGWRSPQPARPGGAAPFAPAVALVVPG
jgi:type IV pilus assembly protein PilV